MKSVFLAALTAGMLVALTLSISQTAEPLSLRTQPIDLAMIDQSQYSAVLSEFDEKSVKQTIKPTPSNELTLTIVDAAAPAAHALSQAKQSKRHTVTTSAVAPTHRPAASVRPPPPVTRKATPVTTAPEPAMSSLRVQQNAALDPALSSSNQLLIPDLSLPKITGFLEPSGFHRTDWQKVHDTLLLAEKSGIRRKFVVMLDPGHGGIDPGAIAHNGLLEKELTLDIARRVKLFLSEYTDLEVILTRDKDYGLTRTSRISTIRDSDADLVISLHFNHLPEPNLNVVETFFASPANVAESRAGLARKALMGKKVSLQHTRKRTGVDISFTRGSKRLANALQRRVFAEVSFSNEEVRDAGAKAATFYVLTQSYKPAALIEITCLSNINEAQKLTTDDYKSRLSSALADGVRDYVDSLREVPLNQMLNIGV
ncbi:MAG: N-acetylmuramoyl-L-alanine amidase [Granulosicoccus sp.]